MTRAGFVVAACLLGLACTDGETGPNVATALEFEALPYPAVVSGDTLRDANGVASPLRGKAFNSDNEEIVAAAIRYAALDGPVTVDSSTGIVVAAAIAKDTSARVIASIGGMQGAPLRLGVVLRPDSAARSGTIDTLRYSVTDTTRNVSAELAVVVLHRATPSATPVRDWLVSFSLQTPADSVRARVVGNDGRRSEIDTTSTSGIASRKIRLFPAGLTSARDSIVLLARVRYRGANVAGSPVRIVLPVRPVAP